MDLINNYFLDNPENESGFNPPAPEKEIANLEAKLSIKLPQDYKDFLLFTNGFEGEIGEFIASFCSVNEVYHDTQLSCAEFFPWAVYIGTNGSLEMFVIDKRTTPYQFGLLPNIGDNADFIPLGDSFEAFIERLHSDTAFRR